MLFRIFIVVASTLPMAPAAMAQVDLHAHLYMKAGLGPLFRGEPGEAARARNPNSRFESKATELTLLEPGSPKITVVSLYAHPWLSNPLKLNFLENVTRGLETQYARLASFVDSRRDRIALVKTPAEARVALKNGKQVLVLSIEGAYGAFETNADLAKWVDERGVAIAGPFHLTEDYFGGTALFTPLRAILFSPLAFLESILLSGGKCLSSFCMSPMGLKPAGRELISTLLEKRVWVDLAHANELERGELLPEFKKRGLPLMVSHTSLRTHLHAEGSLSDLEIEYLSNTGGIVGLIPSDDALMDGNHGGCFSGLTEFKKQFEWLESKVGKQKVMIGSDFNSPIKGLSPSCKAREGEILGAFETTGFFRQEQFKALSDFVATEPDWTKSTEESFLAAWERIRPD